MTPPAWPLPPPPLLACASLTFTRWAPGGRASLPVLRQDKPLSTSGSLPLLTPPHPPPALLPHVLIEYLLLIHVLAKLSETFFAQPRPRVFPCPSDPIIRFYFLPVCSG